MMNFQRDTGKTLELEVQMNAKNKSRTGVNGFGNPEDSCSTFLVHRFLCKL
jgi:hypothetical protein